jgi:hypothetical protein
VTIADAVIFRSGPTAAPLDYVLPAGTELIPLCVTASFDGSAAASSFLPCLEFITPDGKVIGRMPINSSDAVAAAGSADVTFGPF